MSTQHIKDIDLIHNEIHLFEKQMHHFLGNKSLKSVFETGSKPLLCIKIASLSSSFINDHIDKI
ncbi:hypothetical protein KS4_30540 [Poriferisphaera corsica]|uniref:Uncharacterized protein n=1 Tax=Poriferisphaera corsica TaxID=2528020 RepID=A0A517YXP7_9BACT|nr:hypothetical protein KS4_30540 [Poriferisphaera corsica]